jgi:hypothetical protein
MFLGVVPTSRQVKNQRVSTLELGESSEHSALVLELEIGKSGSHDDVFSHLLPPHYVGHPQAARQFGPPDNANRVSANTQERTP